MARHKDANWELQETDYSWDAVQAALLMDIRDELKRLNGVIGCSNFLGIPATLRTIETNTRRRRYTKKR